MLGKLVRRDKKSCLKEYNIYMEVYSAECRAHFVKIFKGDFAIPHGNQVILTVHNDTNEPCVLSGGLHIRVSITP